MNQAEKDGLLTDLDAGLLLLESTERPGAATLSRAATVFKKVRVACQNIPISPTATDPGSPPDPPSPPTPPPTGGGGGGGTGPPPPTTTTTIYTSQGDFSSTQGHRGWYYLEEDGTSMTYNATEGRWKGRQAFQLIWNAGQHPGATNPGGAMRRWTAQGTGTYAITGSVSDQSAGGSTGVRFQVLKNSTAIYTQDIADGGSLTLNLTGSVNTSDTLDFLVKEMSGDVGQDGTLVNLSIALTTQNTSGTGGQTQTTLPFLLNGTAPQEGTLTLNMNKPANADTCTLSVTGVNLDAAYGVLYFNGNSNQLAIWPTNASNTGISATVELPVPVNYVQAGQNTLRFTHDSGSGYTVTAASASFATIVTPEPPATQTSLPFILTGNVLPEDGLLTVTLSKPANAASTCTVSVTGNDLAEAEGTMAVNGTANSMSIWPVNAANNNATRTVDLTVSSSWFNNGTNTIRFTHTSGDGFTISAVTVTFTTIPDPPPPTGGTWPNEPSTHTVKTDWGCTSPLPAGWLDEYNGASLMSLVTNQSGPLSPPSALQARFPVGHPGGSGTGNFSYTYNPGTRSIYVGMWVKHEDPFQKHPDGDKIYYIFAQGGNAHPFYLLLLGSTMTLVWQNTANGTTVDNRHLHGVSGSFFPFLGTGRLGGSVANWTMGTWNRLEVYVRESTSKTSQDGIARWWVNSTLVGNYATLNTEQLGGFMGIHINPVYGGGTQVTKTQQDFVWYDHVRITGGVS